MEKSLFTIAEEKILSYEKTIDELKAKIAKETKENIARYDKILTDLEQKAKEIKKMVHEYKEEGKEN
jgi:uncharacterized coiled-coil protein SlyX